MSANKIGPIGVFDSGYGGLTVLKQLKKRLPQYDYLYLGDNARAPYGTRSFEVVYLFTLQAVQELFDRGCSLVILACNTASAKALRNIQMNDLPKMSPEKRVLGVIRPSSEYIGDLSTSRHVGIMATPGTVNSRSYSIELQKFFPDLVVTEHACPMWVPLIENNQHGSIPGKMMIEEDLNQIMSKDPKIDTLVLACTHYPLIQKHLEEKTADGVQVVAQGEIVAKSLEDYLSRHPEMDALCKKEGKLEFLTTENTAFFDEKASMFYGQEIQSTHISLDK